MLYELTRAGTDGIGLAHLQLGSALGFQTPKVMGFFGP